MQYDTKTIALMIAPADEILTPTRTNTNHLHLNIVCARESSLPSPPIPMLVHGNALAFLGGYRIAHARIQDVERSTTERNGRECPPLECRHMG